MSLDGFIAKPDGNVDWLKKVPNPENTDHGFAKFYETIDTTIMGNNTYKEILGFGIPFPFQDKKNFVLSRQTQADTEYVQFETDAIALVNSLRSQEGRDIWLIGGGQINTLLLNHALIDELLIRIVPIIIGEGLPLFAERPLETMFKLIKIDQFSTGTVQLTYHPIDKK